MATRDTDVKADSNSKSTAGIQPSSPPLGERGIKVSSVVLITLVIAAAFMATALAFLFVQRSVEGLISTTQPVIVSHPITSTVSMLAQPSYDDLMVTQKTVLESTSRAVESINRTADLMLTVNAFLFTVMTAAGAGSLWKASTASNKAGEATRQAKEAVEQAKKAKETLQDVAEHSEDLQQEQMSLAHRITEADQEIARVRKLTKDISKYQKRVMALVQLDEYGMDIRSEDPPRLWKAVSAVLEMSSRPDAIIRRKAVEVLGSLEECDMRVVERLEEMAAYDRARGVQQEAEKALEKLRRLCDEAKAERDRESAASESLGESESEVAG